MEKEKNYTSIIGLTDRSSIVNKLIVPSLKLSKIVQAKKGVDVGTGGGIPGLVLAIVCPDKNLYLMEPKKKKVFFLNKVNQKLNLNNVKIVRGRAEIAGKDLKFRARFDFATCRAVGNLNLTVELVLPLLARGGIYYAEKGSKVNLEVDKSAEKIKMMGGKIVDITRDNIVVIKKISSTPDNLPRSWNRIVK